MSDAVVAPVRESASQALGAVMARMEEEQDVMSVVRLLLQLLKEEEWQCRHGGMLGVRTQKKKI